MNHGMAYRAWKNVFGCRLDVDGPYFPEWGRARVAIMDFRHNENGETAAKVIHSKATDHPNL